MEHLLKLSTTKIILLTICFLKVFYLSGQDIKPKIENAAWLYDEARFGIIVHYLAGGDDAYRHLNTQFKWNQALNSFEVDAFAAQLRETGAGWVIFTVGQTRGFIATPSKIYDANSPFCSEITENGNHNRSELCQGTLSSKYKTTKVDFTPDRDLINDLADALHKKGIRIIVYVPIESPSRWTGKLAKTISPEWYTHYIKETSERWGEKIDGWWVDGYYPGRFGDDPGSSILKRFNNAMRSGNPDRTIVSINRGGFGDNGHFQRTTAWEEYTDGTLSHFFNNEKAYSYPENRYKKGFDGKAQWVHLTPLQGFEAWGNTENEPRFSDDKIALHVKRLREGGGVFSGDVSVLNHGEIVESYSKQLLAINNALDGNPVSMEFIENTSQHIVYKGNWEQVHHMDDHGGSIHQSDTNGASFKLTFLGSGIDVLMRREKVTSGTVPNEFRVYVDGKLQTVKNHKGMAIESYKADNGVLMNQVPVVRIRKLAYGSHIIKLEKINGPHLQLDGFKVLGKPQYQKVTKVDDLKPEKVLDLLPNAVTISLKSKVNGKYLRIDGNKIKADAENSSTLVTHFRIAHLKEGGFALEISQGKGKKRLHAILFKQGFKLKMKKGEGKNTALKWYGIDNKTIKLAIFNHSDEYLSIDDMGNLNGNGSKGDASIEFEVEVLH